jgi:hypothetical protein
MKQFKADHKLYDLVKKVQNSASASSIAAMMFIIFPVGYAFLQGDIPVFNKFWLFETGLLLYFVFTFLSIYRKAEVLSRTIKNFAFDDQTITIKTFEFAVLGLKLIKPKIVLARFKEVSSVKSIFPIKDKDYFDENLCFVLSIKEELFYFKHDCFDEAAAQIVAQN